MGLPILLFIEIVMAQFKYLNLWCVPVCEVDVVLVEGPYIKVLLKVPLF